MRAIKKSVIYIIAVLLLLVFFVPCENTYAANKKIKLNKTNVTIGDDYSVQLKLNKSVKGVKWSSSNKKVATVSSGGLVTARKAGKATITAKYKGKKYNCTVNVKACSTGFKFDEIESGYILSSKDHCKDTDVIIPATYKSKPVVAIGDGAFTWYNTMTSVLIPESIVSIGSSAFSYCSGLEHIIIPDSVVTIGEGAFWNCTGLKEINIPKNVTTIEKDAIYNCSSLTKITVDSENEVYDSRNNCNAIIKTKNNELIFGCAETVITKTIQGIANDAFTYCPGMTSIKIPSNVINFGDNIFVMCTDLQTIYVNQFSFAERWAKNHDYADKIEYYK